MSYTVDTANTKIILDANTTESDLSGLTGLTDGTNPIVDTFGGDISGNAGIQKMYAILAPYTLDIEGSLTVSPEDEMLFMANTTLVDGQNEIRVKDGATLNIAGKITETWGVWYSKATWIRFNRRSTDSFRSTRGVMTFDANATVVWEGGQSQGFGVIGVEGHSTNNSNKLFSNGTISGLNGNMFNINKLADVSFDNFSVIGNRFFDARENIIVSDYSATNSLLEGGNGQTFINYSGNVEYASWNRSEKVRDFVDSENGMSLPINIWSGNAQQRGGQTTITKSGTLTIVDKDKTPIIDSKVSVRTYNDGNRLDYTTLSYATDNERLRYSDQVGISNISGTVNSSGEFAFNQIIKQMTQRSAFKLTINNVVGTFTRGESVLYTRTDGSHPAIVTYHDTANNYLYIKVSTNKYISTNQSVYNTAGTASANISSADQSGSNFNVRYTKGASDTEQVVDCVSISYLNNITTTELDYAGKGSLTSNLFNLPDSSITNTNETQVGNYLLLENNEKAYDFLKLYLYQNWQEEDETINAFVGGYLDYGNFSLVVDGGNTGAAATINGSVVTILIGSNVYEGNLKSNVNITFQNGATTSGLININGVITYPDLNVNITNIVADSRIQIYNITTGLEVKNEIVTGTTYTESYAEGTGYSNGDSIRVRLTNQVGLNAYLGFETVLISTTTGWNVLAAQQLDEVYNTIGVNGSTVSIWDANYTANTAELNTSTDFLISEFYAWWVYNLTTSQGILNFFGGITAFNIANFRINNTTLDFYLDNNAGKSVRQLDNRRFYRADEIYPVSDPTSSNFGLDIVWRNTVLVAEVNIPSPALTPAQSANLAEISSVKTKTDQLEFSGTDLKATLDGEEVVTNLASRNASKADVSALSTFDASTDAVANVTLVATTTTNSDMRGTDGAITTVAGLSTFNPATDTVANVTLVGTTTSNTDMRGTDGANTIAPTTAPTVTEIRAGFVANDFKATTTVSSNMRGTDGAITSVVGLSTFNNTTDEVITNTASRNASKADVSGLSTFDNSTDEVVTNLASRNASKADVSGLSTFDSATDVVANVTLVDTVTTNTDMRGTDGAITSVAGLSTFDASTDEVITNTASRNASKADVSSLSTFDPATDAVANVTLVDTTTTNTDMRGTNGVTIPTNLSTFDPVNDTVANVTLVATTTTNTDMRGTDGAITSVAGLSTFDASTDEVVTDTASRNASKADVSGLSTFNPSTDTVANVTLVNTTTTNTDMRGTDNVNTTIPPTVVEIRAGFNANDFKATETVSSNMRGTDGANTVTPITPPTVVEIRAGFTANDFKATTTVASNMRGTDGANTVVPTNETLTVVQNTKLMSLNTDNLDVAVSTRATKEDVDQSLADYDVDTKTNVKPSIPV